MNQAHKNSPKTWWAPVWRGLVVDSEAKHYRKLKNAIWLWLYFILHADRRTGRLARKYKTISQDMGISHETIRKWLRVLKAKGYVKTDNRGRCLDVEICKWKTTVDCPTKDILGGDNGTPRVSPNGQFQRVNKGENSFNLSPQMEIDSRPNDITIKEILNNDIIDNKMFTESDAFKRFRPRNKQESLALELAEALDDLQGLRLYLSYTKKYPEELLRQVLAEVKGIPLNKIKKSRGALFNHLVKTYGEKTLKNPCD